VVSIALYVSSRNWIVRAGTTVVVGAGVLVFVGWLLNIAVLKSVLPGWATMKVNTACGFIASGAALWLLHASPPGSGRAWLARALAVLVTALGVLTLAEAILGTDLGIDRLLLPVNGRATMVSQPGRMSPAAAFNLMMIGSSLLVLNARKPGFAAAAQWLAILPLLVSMLAVLGYACGVSSLYEIKPYTTIAIHTALAFLILIFSLLAADSDHGIASIACSDTAGGAVARRLLPSLPAALLILGWGCLAGEDAKLYDNRFGMALMIPFSMIVCVTAVSWTALALRRVDLTRKAAESDVIAINAGLERRVEERTQQLATMSEKLTAANKALEQLSLVDALTGLANRRHFDSHLAAQIAIAHRERRFLALVMCDVDAFKAYNDHYGHQAGDECLQRVATALSSCCRRPADMAARYGGEEFALILPETDLIGARKIAEAAREAIARLKIAHAFSPTGPSVSICGGVSVISPQDIDLSAKQLITAADENLFRAKASGRNRIVSA